MRRRRFDLTALRQRVSITDLLTSMGYDVPLRGNRMPCPLHRGNNRQSFAITSDRFQGGYFHCFGCGAHGDVFTLAQALLGCNFRHAVDYVAGLAGYRTDAAVPALTRASILARRRERERQAAESRQRNIRLLRCADDYRVLTKRAVQVGRALALTDDDAVWRVLDVLYARRDHVEAVEGMP